MHDNQTYRISFNQQADLYDDVRPTYPEELFNHLVNIIKLTPHSKLLEIGPGTGQATLPFAMRGYEIGAIELGPEMARKATTKLSRYKNVRLQVADFELIDLPLQSYDLIYAATAFHWISEAVGFKKSYDLLKPYAYLAIIHTEDVSDERGDEFFHLTKPLYDHYLPGGEDYRPPRIDQLKPMPLNTQFFELADFSFFPMTMKYTTSRYIDLMSTFSPIIMMEDSERRLFLDGIRSIIDRDFGGSITRNIAITLNVLKKNS